jgi:hypothetical protein
MIKAMDFPRMGVVGGPEPLSTSIGHGRSRSQPPHPPSLGRSAVLPFQRLNVPTLTPPITKSSGTVVPNRAALNSLHGTQNGSLGSALAGVDADALEAK